MDSVNIFTRQSLFIHPHSALPGASIKTFSAAHFYQSRCRHHTARCFPSYPPFPHPQAHIRDCEYGEQKKNESNLPNKQTTPRCEVAQIRLGVSQYMNNETYFRPAFVELENNTFFYAIEFGLKIINDVFCY